MIKRTSTITFFVICFASSLYSNSTLAAFYQPVYGVAQTYSGFNYTTSITSGDIDGDGDKDLLATRLLDDKVSVLLNDGSGHFTIATTYAIAHWPYQVTLADMNGDGHLDIVTANQGNQSSQIHGNVSILLNNGDGTFAMHHDYGTGPASRSVAIADFDNDGDLDVATGNILSDGDRPASVTTYLNDGSGNLSHETYYPRHGTSYVTAADVNHDGLVDLAVTNGSDLSASIFFNTGNANFGNEEIYILGTGAVAPELHDVHSSSFADLDNDGDLDWVIGNRNIDKITFLYNDGNGKFGRRMDCGAVVPQFEYINDFNKDGILDVMTVNHHASIYNSVSILLGLSNGMYSNPVIVPMGTAAIEATVGDFNRDNQLDLATADYFGNSVTTKLSTGSSESNLDTTSNNCSKLPALSGNITSPSDNNTIGAATIQFAADASYDGGNGIKQVEFYVLYDRAWHSAGIDTTSPYFVFWQTPNQLDSLQLQFRIDIVGNDEQRTEFAGGVRHVNFIKSNGNPGVIENWIPIRAYVNQLSLSPDGDSKCNVSSMAMALAMEGLIGLDYLSMADKANEMYPNVLIDDIAYVYKMRDELRRQKAESEWKGPWSVDTAWPFIKAEIDAGHPVIIGPTPGVVTPVGHFVVGVGYQEANSKRLLITYDPFGQWQGKTCSELTNNCSGNYDRNVDGDRTSHKGQWVYYNFDKFFSGNDGYLITVHRRTDDDTRMALSLTPPDSTSSEPQDIGTYQGVSVANISQIYLPLVRR